MSKEDLNVASDPSSRFSATIIFLPSHRSGVESRQSSPVFAAFSQTRPKTLTQMHRFLPSKGARLRPGLCPEEVAVSRRIPGGPAPPEA